jgi:hypothetical protein
LAVLPHSAIPLHAQRGESNRFHFRDSSDSFAGIGQGDPGQIPGFRGFQASNK